MATSAVHRHVVGPGCANSGASWPAQSRGCVVNELSGGRVVVVLPARAGRAGFGQLPAVRSVLPDELRQTLRAPVRPVNPGPT